MFELGAAALSCGTAGYHSRMKPGHPSEFLSRQERKNTDNQGPLTYLGKLSSGSCKGNCLKA